MLLLIDLLDPGEYGRSVTLLCVVTMKSDSNLTPELSRAAKRHRLERMVRLEGTTECVTPQAATVIVMKETLRAADPVRGRGSCSRSRQRRQRESRTSETPSAPLEN